MVLLNKLVPCAISPFCNSVRVQMHRLRRLLEHSQTFATSCIIFPITPLRQSRDSFQSFISTCFWIFFSLSLQHFSPACEASAASVCMTAFIVNFAAAPMLFFQYCLWRDAAEAVIIVILILWLSLLCSNPEKMDLFCFRSDLVCRWKRFGLNVCSLPCFTIHMSKTNILLGLEAKLDAGS